MIRVFVLILIIGSTFSLERKFRVLNGTLGHSGLTFIAHLDIKIVRTIGRTTFRRNMICGGSFIKKDVILTAGHCVRFIEPENILVRFGTLSPYEENIQTASVKTVVVHEDYNQPSIYNNDIALIFLDEAVDTGPLVSLIQLSHIQEFDVNSTATAAGWGVDENGEYPEHLQKTEFSLIGNDVCQKLTNSEVTENMLCANGRNNSTTCLGDSGGPLVLENRLIGIMAWSMEFVTLPNRRQTCKTDLPAVFIRVARYTDWISRKIAENI